MNAAENAFDVEGPIRVLRIIARMNVGGPALQVVALTEGLNPQRFSSRLLVGDVGSGEADYLDLRAPHVSARRVPGLGRSPNPWGDVRALASIIKEIRRFRPHIVHTHTAKAGVLGRTAARITRTPATVHTYHGHLLSGYFSPAVTKGVVTVEKSFAPGTTRLVTVGEQVKEDLLAVGVGSPPQYTVVPPGVSLPPALARSEGRTLLGLPQEIPLVAFVARLTSIKRPDRFVEVCKQVAQRLPAAEFIVAGGGKLLNEMKRQALPLGRRVRFLNWRSDIQNVYAAADVVLLTSDNEGMPVSLIEAALVGTPVVTTSVGSASEVVVDGVTGLVTSTDVGELAEATVALLEDHETRRQMGKAASERALREFSSQRLIDDTEKLYEAIAAEKGFG
jgi:glycosyltransferase involved in cell wall biosynthesis